MPTPDKNKAALEGLIAKANAATGGADTTVTDAVDTLIAGFGQGGGDLPDWDDDSPVIASGAGATSNAVWELTEKGTMRWTMVDPNLTSGENAIAGFKNTALSVVPLDFLDIATKIRQIYIPDGFLTVKIVVAINCERIRLPSTLTSAPVLNAAGVRELDLSGYTFTTINQYQFQSLIRAEKILLPPAVTNIPMSTFQLCYTLREINLDNITVFGNNAFSELFNLIGTIDFNESLTSIGAGSFYRTRLNVLRFHNALDALPTIATNSFGQCRALTDIYVPWAEGAVANAPWGATSATIHYNTVYDSDGNPVE